MTEQSEACQAGSASGRLRAKRRGGMTERSEVRLAPQAGVARSEMAE
jgi:hypothetical protein